jgi:Transposase IS116/IS110/IS902 family.
MELSVATVGKRAIAPDASTADALEQAGEQVDSIAVAGSPTPGLAPPDILDPRPQLVGHRRVRSPGGRPALLIQAAMAADPAVVERVAQDVADAIGLETRLGLCPLVRQSGNRDVRGPLAKNGPRYLRWALIEAATHAARHPAYQFRYERTKQRLGRQRGAKVARVDLARKLAEAIWHVLTKNEPFAPAGPTMLLVA